MKKFTVSTLPILFFVLTSCFQKPTKIFYISEPNGHENDLLFMAESTNIFPIKDSLLYYLTTQEILSAEKLTFKNFGTIYSSHAFKLRVLLKEGSNSGRDYSFIFRTFDGKHKIIDSYEFAAWKEFEKRFCFGSIDENLQIERSCEKDAEKEVWKIDATGNFIQLQN